MISPLAGPGVAPRYRTVPESFSSAGREAVDLAASAGLVLDPWEVAALEDALAERPDGRWAAFEVGLIVPRQNGKGAILEARELAGLFLFGDRLILHSAHEFKTAADAFRRVWSLIENTPDLERRVFKKLENNNGMLVELKNKQRLRFVARSTGSGRGFTADTVILDEAYNLSARAMSAMLPTLSARPNPQVWYTSSAPMADEPSRVLRRLCRRGRKGSPRLAYVEYAADKDCDPADRAAWAEANPNLGVRVTEEWIEEVEFDVLEPEDFARERLGIWDDDEYGAWLVIPQADWVGCEDPRSGPVGRVAFALDVSPDRAWGSFAVAGESGCGGVHVELVDHLPGTDWLVSRAKELQERWGGGLVVASGSPAASLLTELKDAGVEVVEVSSAEHAQACGAFYDAAVQRRLRHLGQPELAVALAAADRKYSGDAWLWSRRSTAVDISPVVAVTLAKWAFEHPAPAGLVPFFGAT